MTEGSTSSLKRLLSRSNSVARGQYITDPVSHQPGLLDPRSGIVWPDEETALVSAEFVTGCSLLRVTRKKTRTRIFTINETTGVVAIDDAPKFSVDAIRDIRIGEDAAHYRELCKISAEHESGWLSIVYFLEGTKLKVLHVVCPSQETKRHFRQSLLRLHYQRARLIGATASLFGQDQAIIDEDMWCTLVPSSRGHNIETSNPGILSSPQQSGSPTLTRRNMNSQLSFAEVRTLCTRLHFNPPEAYLLRTFKEVDIEEKKSIDFPAFKRLVNILKTRQDILEIYNYHKGSAEEMTRKEFITFLQDVQGLNCSKEALHRIFERACEPTSQDNKQGISATNFTAYVLSRHNSLLYNISSDMSRPLNEYFVSSSHNTYLTGRQVGDESSIEPYIRVLQKGCRCIEIDIWSSSEGAPEVRHGRAFTSAVPLESVLKAIDKYAFIVSPWPLIISLEIRCHAKTQGIVAVLLTRIFGDVLLLTRLSAGESSLPSPADLRHRILLKIKSAGYAHEQFRRQFESRFEHAPATVNDYAVRADGIVSTAAEDSSVSTSAPESDFEIPSRISRASSVSSRSSSYSSSASPIYRSFAPKSSAVIDDLIVLAPYLKGIKFRNFSLPESKVFNHIFSLSERTIKQFNPETLMQVQKHNTRFMMRIYPSQTRVMSSNFLPHHYWQQGIQMVAMNCQTQDAGQRMNEAFFAADDHSSDTTGYVLKPPHMQSWEKGQDLMCRKWRRERWTITIISGTQLPKGQSSSGQICPFVELELYRPSRSSNSMSGRVSERAREVKFRTKTIEDNGFNPRFDTAITFTLYEDEDPYFTFLQFLVRESVSNDVLGQCFVPLHRLQQGYRSVALYDGQGERFIFSSLFVKISHRSTS